MPAWVRFGDDTVLCHQSYGAIDQQHRAKRFVAVAHRLFGEGDALTDKRLVLSHLMAFGEPAVF